jgi:hypothetical protein
MHIQLESVVCFMLLLHGTRAMDEEEGTQQRLPSNSGNGKQPIINLVPDKMELSSDPDLLTLRLGPTSQSVEHQSQIVGGLSGSVVGRPVAVGSAVLTPDPEDAERIMESDRSAGWSINIYTSDRQKYQVLLYNWTHQHLLAPFQNNPSPIHRVQSQKVDPGSQNVVPSADGIMTQEA